MSCTFRLITTLALSLFYATTCRHIFNFPLRKADQLNIRIVQQRSTMHQHHARVMYLGYICILLGIALHKLFDLNPSMKSKRFIATGLVNSSRNSNFEKP